VGEWRLRVGEERRVSQLGLGLGLGCIGEGYL
jgi:hypothetical protein